MGRKNHRTRPTQTRWREVGKTPKRTLPPIEEMVIPKGRCHFPHRKLKFTQTEAAEALAQAKQTREARGQQGHAEKRAYECEKSDGGCGMWHLTSREKWEKR